MIIDKKNPYEIERKNIDKIKLLWDVRLPKGYCVRVENEINLIKKSWLFNYKIAEVKLDEDIIILNFEEEEDYLKLRKYFKDSDSKFKLFVNLDSYY